MYLYAYNENLKNTKNMDWKYTQQDQESSYL